MSSGSTIVDIPIGKKVSVTKTVSEDAINTFAELTGDFDPNHVDEEYCKTTVFGKRIAHGALIVGYMSTASTLILEDFGAPLVSVGYDKIRFVQPVYINDVVTITYEITGTIPERNRTIGMMLVTNQDGAVVAAGTHIQQIV